MAVRIISCFCLILSVAFGQQVVTPDGPINGIVETTISGNSYYAYYSIPYVKPALGSLRFQPPQAPDPWTEPHDGTKENPNVCYQVWADYSQENEDCLHMNVFTPASPDYTGDPKPVLVNIHGGGFIAGSGLVSSDATGGFWPKYLIEQDILVVSFNYRLGAFGFLSTGDDVIPGNAGLRDQIQALKWVQKNIAAFGGDPTKVTISGQSAGAASVGYLILSPEAEGLFAGAIMESGTPLDPWAFSRNLTQITFKTASFVDSQFETSTDSNKLLEVLQNADARAIKDAGTAFANWDSGQPDGVYRSTMQQGFYFAPTIEKAGSSPVISEYMYESLVNGNVNKVPVLIGICSEEGLVNTGQYFDNNMIGYDSNPAFLVPQDLNFADWNTWGEIGQAIKAEYSPSDTFLNNKLAGIQYFTENDFARGAVKHAELQSAQSDVYFYQFSYSGGLGWNTEHQYPGSGNVSHVEEWGYLFYGWPISSYSEDDQTVQHRMVRFWTNFVKYQNPTPDADELLQNIIWPKVTSSSFSYLHIGNFSDPTLTLVSGKPKAARLEFWDSIYEKYGNRPFDTY